MECFHVTGHCVKTNSEDRQPGESGCAIVGCFWETKAVRSWLARLSKGFWECSGLSYWDASHQVCLHAEKCQCIQVKVSQDSLTVYMFIFQPQIHRVPGNKFSEKYRTYRRKCPLWTCITQWDCEENDIPSKWLNYILRAGKFDKNILPFRAKPSFRVGKWRPGGHIWPPYFLNKARQSVHNLKNIYIHKESVARTAMTVLK